jgi:hypothetical protein
VGGIDCGLMEKAGGLLNCPRFHEAAGLIVTLKCRRTTLVVEGLLGLKWHDVLDGLQVLVQSERLRLCEGGTKFDESGKVCFMRKAVISN